MMDYKIPDKLTFKRKEVIQFSRLDGKVIDFWEKEFRCFIPVVNTSGEKFYTRKDLELILKIKHLLIEEKLDKSKVKEILQNEMPFGTEFPAQSQAKPMKSEKLGSIKTQLKEILTILDKNDKK